ncbi:MAG: hypothetical protein KGH69_02780 [Candidatus Micrarchaeota archaeon]|nr:hypothetical protein [Candidatus Micrarchaeota archaeon]
MDRKKLTQILITLFIAVIFITSYFSLTNYNSSQANATTTVPPTIFTYGIANASIYDYGSTMSITISCGNATNGTMSGFSTLLSGLETNGSVVTDYSVGNRINIDIGSLNASALYGHLAQQSSTKELNCSTFSGTAVLLLPPSIKAQVQGSTYTIYLPDSVRRYSIPVTFPINSTRNITVKVSTLITANGTVYGNINVARV